MSFNRAILSRVFIISLYCGSVFAQSNVPSELVHYPEFVFYNGQVLTADADENFTIAQAVAVRGNRIFKVGDNSEIRPLSGPNTRVINLNGRSLTPGFIYNDADNAVPAGDILKDSQWGGVTHPHLGGETIDQTLATLAFIVDNEGKDGAPVFFNLQDTWSGTAMKIWDKNTLDEVAPDTPVLVSLESSEALVNTAMLELAFESGLSSEHFHLQKDENGEFTGRVGAQVAGFIGREVRPWPDPIWFDDVAVPGAIESLADYARYGITVATGHMSAPTMTILNRLFHEQPDDLKVRVYPGLDFLRQNPNGEMYLKRMGNLVDFSLTDDRGPMVTIVGASVGPHSGTPDGMSGLLSIDAKDNVIDGLSQNPRGDNRWTAEWITGLGQGELSPEQQRQTDYYNVMLARQHGWNVTGIHNMGSEGIRLAMQNVVEAEQQENLYVKELWRPHGFDHNIEWVDEIFEYYDAHPELKDKNLVRFAVSLTNGVDQRSSEPLGIERLTEAQWGMAGLERMAPLNMIRQKGVPFHIEGSGPSNPLRKIQQAVTRKDRDGRVIAANQVITRKEAFLALTRWPARFIGDTQLGSIQAGMLADLVIFNGDIMETPIEDLANLNAVFTMVGGKVAFEAPEL